MDNQNNTFAIKTKTWINGASIVTSIPASIAQYLGIEAGDDVNWIPDKAKHGNFAGVWNPKQQQRR